MLDFETIKENLIVKISSEKRLVELISRLSVQFTSKREDLADYWSDPEMVSAYALFYFPTNYAKFSWTLEKIGNDFLREDLEIIDLGCGPGTFLHAFKNYFPILKNFIGIEHSLPMRNQAQKLWERAFPEVSCEFIESVKNLKKKNKPRLLIFGHSLNEMETQSFEVLVKKIEPDFILFIEPGTKDSFVKIKTVRKILLDKKFTISYPCPSHDLCPMEGTDNWCHQYVIAHFEPEIERLCQLVKLDRRHMPVIMHFYQKEGQKKLWQEDEAFIVQTFPETKFSVEWEVCQNHVKDRIEHFQLLKRNLKKSDVKELKTLLAGDKLKVEIEKKLEENSYRLKRVGPASLT